MYRASEFINKDNMIRILKDNLPLFLLRDSEIIEIKHVSKKFYRDRAPLETDKDHPEFPEDTGKYAIDTRKDVLFENSIEAEAYKRIEYSKHIMKNFDSIRREYLKMKKFKEENPQYFI